MAVIQACMSSAAGAYRFGTQSTDTCSRTSPLLMGLPTPASVAATCCSSACTGGLLLQASVAMLSIQHLVMLLLHTAGYVGLLSAQPPLLCARIELHTVLAHQCSHCELLDCCDCAGTAWQTCRWMLSASGDAHA
jgi:hypothetical protein